MFNKIFDKINLEQEEKSSNFIVPDWWHYDSIISTLHCEVKGELISFPCLVVESDEAENAWQALSPDDKLYLLWKDKEFSLDSETVAEVENWSLCASLPNPRGYNYGLYSAIIGKCKWQWEPNFCPNVRLSGEYHLGGKFEDTIRLLIPLENDSVLAISNRNRRYYLHGHAIDERLVLAPKPQKHRRKRTI